MPFVPILFSPFPHFFVTKFQNYDVVFSAWDAVPAVRGRLRPCPLHPSSFFLSLLASTMKAMATVTRGVFGDTERSGAFPHRAMSTPHEKGPQRSLAEEA